MGCYGVCRDGGGQLIGIFLEDMFQMKLDAVREYYPWGSSITLEMSSPTLRGSCPDWLKSREAGAHMRPLRIPTIEETINK
jgi:hypothetical protein